MAERVRLDRWLWAVRLFKTRSASAEACRLGRITMAGKPAKPSRLVEVGVQLDVDKEDVRRQLTVTGILEKRVPAKDVSNFFRDDTPPEAFARARQIREEAKLNAVTDERPSKRDRRQMEAFLKAIK